MEIMELREALMEAQNAAALEKISGQNEEAMEDTLAGLAKAFAVPDMHHAALLAMRLSYLAKIKDEIRIRRKSVSA
jgi:hypothetical protein